MRHLFRSPLLQRALVPAALVVVGVALSGCASKSAQYESQAPAWGVHGPAVAQSPAPRPEEIEDDGLPAQTVPTHRARAIPDDPREPWSRNYGTVPARKSVDSTPAPVQPQTTQPVSPPPAPRPSIMPQRPRFATIAD